MPAAQEPMVDAATLGARVREALSARYAHPIVRDDESIDGVRVLGGGALIAARDAAGPANSHRVQPIDVSGAPWHDVPSDGLQLWRQFGASGPGGELVTELVAGDPPVQLVLVEDGWRLVRTADGAQGWLAAGRDVGAACAAWTTTATSHNTTVDVAGFITRALQLLDVPYVWGGTTDAGVDCSGLVQRAAWDSSRVWLPRHSRALLKVGERIAPRAPARGDVLVLRRDASTIDAERRAQLAALERVERDTGVVPAHGPAVHPMHVAIAVAADEALHASRDAMRVVREPLTDLRSRYQVLGVRRLGPQ